MTTCIRTLGVSLILLGYATGCAVEPVSPGQPRAAEGLEVSTAPVRVPSGGQARMVVSKAFDDDVRIPVTIVFKDVNGRVLDRREGVVARGKPLIESLGRQGYVSKTVALRRVASTDGVLLQNQLSFGPVDSESDSCPVHVSMEVDGTDDSETYLCPGIDPCGGGGTGTQGPAHGSDVFPACASQPAQ